MGVFLEALKNTESNDTTPLGQGRKHHSLTTSLPEGFQPKLNDIIFY